MRKFREDLLTNKNLVVNCKTEEQAKELLTWADSRGKTWCIGRSYIDLIEFHHYLDDTYYNIVKGTYGEVGDCSNARILSFEEALESQYIEFEPTNTPPSWWNGKPIVCRVSDKDEECKVDIFAIIVFAQYQSEYPFRVMSSFEENPLDCTLDSYRGSWRYAIPYVKPSAVIDDEVYLMKNNVKVPLTDEQKKVLGL